MHRIDTATALPGGTFTEGDPMVPVPATEVSADWLNAVQAELAAVITAAGIALDKQDNAQLAKAIAALLAAHAAADPAHPASKVGFNNAVAALAGNPTRVQAAIEALTTKLTVALNELAAAIAAHAAANPAHAAFTINFDNAVAGLDGAPTRMQAAIEAILTRSATTNRLGLVRLATTAAVAALSDASQAVTPAALGSVFPRYLAGNGYQKLPGGLIIQWWGADFTNANGDAWVTFPIAFPTAVFHVSGHALIYTGSYDPLDVNIIAWDSGTTNLTGARMVSTDYTGAKRQGSERFFAIGI